MRAFRSLRIDSRLFYTVFAIALIAIRNPAYLARPRIWAEEGSIYIQAFLDHGLWVGLYSPHLGYYSLFSNMATSLSASALGLKWSAYGTTYFSLVVMLGCVLAPLYLPSQYWDTKKKRAVLVFSSIVVATPEIWLNTINLQFYLGLFTCYVLFSNLTQFSKRLFVATAFLLFLASLNGVPSVVLLPMFLARILISENVERSRLKALAGVLAVGLVIQLLAFASGLDTPTGDRLSLSDIANFPVGFARTSLYLFQGNSQTVSVALVLLFATLLFAYAIMRGIRHRFVLAAYLYTAFLYTLLSLEMLGGGRYGYIPSVLLVLLIVNSYDSSGPRLARSVLILGTVLLAYKLQFYFDTEQFYHGDWESFSASYSQAIREGSTSIPVFPRWEGTDWKIDLSPTDQ